MVAKRYMDDEGLEEILTKEKGVTDALDTRVTSLETSVRPVNKGGTGKSTFTSGRLLVGNGTGAIGERAITGTIKKGSTDIPTSNAVQEALWKSVLSNTTFGGMSDSELVMAVNLADKGLLDLYTDLGWRVGDERMIHIDDIVIQQGTSESSKVTYPGKDYSFVLLDRGSNQTFTLVNSVKDTSGNARTKPSFVVGMKEVFGYGIENNQHRGVHLVVNGPGCFDNTSVKTWLNEDFKNALNKEVVGIFKQFKAKTTKWYSYGAIPTVVDTTTYFCIPSVKEIYGTSSPNLGENNTSYFKRFAWFNDAGNYPSGNAKILKIRNPNATPPSSGGYYAEYYSEYVLTRTAASERQQTNMYSLIPNTYSSAWVSQIYVQSSDSYGDVTPFGVI